LTILAFSPDGNRIVSGGFDQTARVWEATPLPSNVIAEHDARYRKKIETLTLDATTDDARRAEVLAGSGRWDQAAEAFARAVEKEPEKLQVRCQLIDALLKSGNASQVGPACNDILKRFGNTGVPLQAMAVAALCRLAPQAIADLEKRDAVHEMAMAKDNAGRLAILAKYGQLDLVSHALAKAVEDLPDDFTHDDFTLCRLHLLSLLESGEVPGYRVAAGKLLSRFSKTSDPNLLRVAARVFTYAPEAVPDLAVPVQMAEAALAGCPADQKKWGLLTLGAALYRAGRTDEAIARLNESVKASGGVVVPESWALLAMAHHKKGNGDEARRWLEKLRSHKPDAKTATDFSSDLWLVEGRILLREAEALLREPPPARP
jgi:tetratricopeptide (TPR) repeat protein